MQAQTSLICKNVTHPGTKSKSNSVSYVLYIWFQRSPKKYCVESLQRARQIVYVFKKSLSSNDTSVHDFIVLLSNDAFNFEINLYCTNF